MYGNLIHTPDAVYISPPGYAMISPAGHFDVPIPPGSQTVYQIPQDSVMHVLPQSDSVMHVLPQPDSVMYPIPQSDAVMHVIPERMGGVVVNTLA